MPSDAEDRPWRVLIALLVYNGEDYVVGCLKSLTGLDPGVHDVDVLVLDDASPAPGWSERCRELTTSLGFSYYRSPRNLGIPRNMNLGLLRGLDAGYDAVVLLNSDTVVPRNLVPAMVRPLQQDPAVASTTAWSNHVSIFSLPNDDPDRLLRHRPELVTWISDRLDEEFAGQAIALPSGVGFCMCLPTSVVRQIGLMDPVFGRGYSEEVDWCLRSHAAGFISALAPSCFVYHAGSGINKVEGLLGPDSPAMNANQRLIDDRYPLYGSQIVAYTASSIPGSLERRGLGAIILAAARQFGYRLELSRLSARPGDDDRVRFVVDPDGESPVITARFQGFRLDFAVGEGGVRPTVAAIVGQPPDEVRIFERGALSAELLADAAGRPDYPLTIPPYREQVL